MNTAQAQKFPGRGIDAPRTLQHIAEPLPPVTHWTTKELDRLDKRVVLFRRRGMSADQAAEFAERVAARDRDLDGRRACIECLHWLRGGACAKSMSALQDVLQRCSGFAWEVPA